LRDLRAGRVCGTLRPFVSESNVVSQAKGAARDRGDPMDTNRLLIIAAAVAVALLIVWYFLPGSTPTAPTVSPPPATAPEQPQ
jgi:hypothetical protein